MLRLSRPSCALPLSPGRRSGVRSCLPKVASLPRRCCCRPATVEAGRWLGAAAALATALLWAAGLVATRFGVTGALSLWDVIFLRLAMPALLLVPILLRFLQTPANASAGQNRPFWYAVMIVGAGLPFMLIGSGGMVFAPAAHAGALMPGSMPLFAALFAVLLLGESFNAQRRFGTLLMLLGAIAVGGWQAIEGTSGTWRGDLMFVCAGAMWACYTIALKKTGIGPWQAAAVVYVASSWFIRRSICSGSTAGCSLPRFSRSAFRSRSRSDPVCSVWRPTASPFAGSAPRQLPLSER